MNIPQIEKEKKGPAYPAYQKKDYERLKILYGISKLLSNFETVEITFPEILSLGAHGFPLLTAILIEHWEQKPKTTIWHAENATEEQVSRATLNARKAYGYMAGSSLSEKDDLQTDSASVSELESEREPQISSADDQQNYIVLPLVINKLPPYGALQLQGSASLDEADLEFVGALTDLICVALDRFYKTKKEREFRKKEAEISAGQISASEERVSDLEIERQLREDFVSLLTHDLRTPLSAVQMAAQLIIRKSDDSAACLSLASRIVNNINRTDQMISNLLDANNIRSGGKLPLHIEHFKMAGLIKATLEELTTIHGDRFIFNNESDVEGYWDRKSVQRILENLCSNAIKYGSPISPVTITLQQSEAGAKVSVMNKGDIIREEDQKFLFKQFKRGEKAIRSNKKGWGIGLTLVQGVAEAHGGSVTVESTLEKGTIFTINLPINARVQDNSTQPLH